MKKKKLHRESFGCFLRIDEEVHNLYLSNLAEKSTINYFLDQLTTKEDNAFVNPHTDYDK